MISSIVCYPQNLVISQSALSQFRSHEHLDPTFFLDGNHLCGTPPVVSPLEANEDVALNVWWRKDGTVKWTAAEHNMNTLRRETSVFSGLNGSDHLVLHIFPSIILPANSGVLLASRLSIHVSDRMNANL